MATIEATTPVYTLKIPLTGRKKGHDKLVDKVRKLQYVTGARVSKDSRTLIVQQLLNPHSPEPYIQEELKRLEARAKSEMRRRAHLSSKPRRRRKKLRPSQRYANKPRLRC